MVVENAELFGLSQLHQLRGRVGRGSEKSYCILLYRDATDEGRARLKTLTETSPDCAGRQVAGSMMWWKRCPS